MPSAVLFKQEVELMNDHLKTCSPESTLDAVAQIMWENECDSVDVIDAAGRPIGAVTGYDMALASRYSRRPLWDVSVGEVLKSRERVMRQASGNVVEILAPVERQSAPYVIVVDDWVLYK